MPVAVSFNLKIRPSAYHISRGRASGTFSFLLLPSALAPVCGWAEPPAFVPPIPHDVILISAKKQIHA